MYICRDDSFEAGSTVIELSKCTRENSQEIFSPFSDLRTLIDSTLIATPWRTTGVCRETKIVQNVPAEQSLMQFQILYIPEQLADKPKQPVVLPVATDANKWAGEDEEEEVKVSGQWDRS